MSLENSVWRRQEPEVTGRSVYVDFRINANLGSFHICDQKPPWAWRDSCRAGAVFTDHSRTLVHKQKSHLGEGKV